MSEPVWVPMGASPLPNKAVYPIDFRNPSVGSFPGNAYPLVLGRTSFEEWAWAFIATATGVVYGYFRVPENAPDGTAKLKFDLASAGAGPVNVTAYLTGIADGETMNFAAWSWGPWTENVTLAANARKVWATTGFTVGAAGTLSAGDLVVVRFARNGADAGDTNASVLELLYGAMVYD